MFSTFTVFLSKEDIEKYDYNFVAMQNIVEKHIQLKFPTELPVIWVFESRTDSSGATFPSLCVWHVHSWVPSYIPVSKPAHTCCTGVWL